MPNLFNAGRGLAAALLLAVLALPARAAERDQLTLVLDWFLNPDHAPIVIAQERGYFADNGLKVSWQEPADPNNPPKLVAAGKADLAVSYQPNLHLQVDQGLPLVRVGTLVATPLNTVIALEDGPIDELADLKGKTVGYSVGGFEETMLKVMLREAGVDPSTVELVNVNFALSQSLLSGRVDAIVGGFRNFEVNQLKLNGAQAQVFYPEAHGVPAYDELIFIAHREQMDRDKLRRFLDAVERGTQYLVNHPQKSWEIFRDGRPDVQNALNKRAFPDTIPRFALRPAALGSARYQRFAAFLQAHGMIETVPPVDQYAVELPAAVGTARQ
ncbi:ABC transporter ATP-binding protein [Rhodovibrio sodomensis]|uniref:ABC transporter ATP-binding protein n=1 Tax=Rhodovibrio sodomensis TaxID=1088 RepID=A0ABS1DC79_9PROT|nr:ABC transporter substrate-binding protein [Rhodovibrio sodomensis]MBK1667990.1 ABC transporter ATP-binding protein [Rhodovibrio sodomensis]